MRYGVQKQSFADYIDAMLQTRDLNVSEISELTGIPRETLYKLLGGALGMADRWVVMALINVFGWAPRALVRALDEADFIKCGGVILF